MTDIFTTTGVVATTPRHVVTQDGLPITSFRLAATNRRYDRDARQWTNGETNWFTVTAFRQLALNAATSVAKGERVIVTGRLKIRDWDNGERAGTVVEVDAVSIGHDLGFGTSSYVRSVRSDAASDHAVSAFDPDEAMVSEDRWSETPGPADEALAAAPEASGSRSDPDGETEILSESA